ncbi:MAG: M1 family peptidase [Sphingobacteriales bacterium]|nr:MAG: M1 family peptidase [Sphingobacteriales bacterium]
MLYQNKTFTRADTLRGSVTPERAWWDIQRYDLTVQPDYVKKSSVGSNLITYIVTNGDNPGVLQLDLQEPLHIDKVVANGKKKLTFKQDGNAWFINTGKQKAGTSNTIEVFFSGTPHESTRPPWSGGWTFTKDSLGRPWMTVTCQGLGASIWYPCKDYQGDEPDKGASLTMIAPDSLVAVANGRQDFRRVNKDGTATTKWSVVNPISNYCLIPYIGKYVQFHEDYNGEKGKLDLDYWVLDYNLAKAKAYLPIETRNMMASMEYWFGPYPFYEDGFKLVDVEHTGMEHQSAVAYGNHYAPGYRGRDGSGTNYAWDFIIIHESGHEWFGNNITTRDLADMYIHEGFTNYSETLFVEYLWGKEAGNNYNFGIRRGIRNDIPVIPRYNVNEQGSGDMYTKGSNMLHTIRHSLDNDSLWRQILRGMNKTFYHQTVTADQVHDYINKQAGVDYTPVLNQYLKTVKIPDLELIVSDDKRNVRYRYANCNSDFNLPLTLRNDKINLKLLPTTTWQTLSVTDAQLPLFDAAAVQKMYYLGVKKMAGN